jgi:hypothetical protein
MNSTEYTYEKNGSCTVVVEGIKKFICLKCFSKFKKFKTLKQHTENHINLESTCGICLTFRFTSAIVFINHTKMHFLESLNINNNNNNNNNNSNNNNNNNIYDQLEDYEISENEENEENEEDDLEKIIQNEENEENEENENIEEEDQIEKMNNAFNSNNINFEMEKNNDSINLIKEKNNFIFNFNKKRLKKDLHFIDSEVTTHSKYEVHQKKTNFGKFKNLENLNLYRFIKKANMSADLAQEMINDLSKVYESKKKFFNIIKLKKIEKEENNFILYKKIKVEECGHTIVILPIEETLKIKFTIQNFLFCFHTKYSPNNPDAGWNNYYQTNSFKRIVEKSEMDHYHPLIISGINFF